MSQASTKLIEPGPYKLGYDPLGRRAKKTVGNTSTFFLGDDQDEEIGEYTAAGAVVYRFVPGPAIDQPIAQITSADVRTYFHKDRLGSVVAMSNASAGQSEGPYNYDGYGRGAQVTGTPYKYTGRRLDPETKLYYYRARYYSTELGRFLQTDPIGYADDTNLYVYVGNDPSNKIDPTGLQTSRLSVGCQFQIYCDGEDRYRNPFAVSEDSAVSEHEAIEAEYRQDFVTPLQNSRNDINDAADAVSTAVEEGFKFWAFGVVGRVFGGSKAVLGKKLDFILGNATGSKHNTDRSQALYAQIQRIGLSDTPTTRKYLSQHLAAVLSDPTNVSRIQSNGRVVKESILYGPKGAAGVETIWEGNKLITVKMFGG